MNIFHYKKSSGEYKAMDMNPTDDKTAVFWSITKGVKNGSRDRLIIKCDKKELAYIILEGQKLYNELEEKENDYKSND